MTICRTPLTIIILSGVRTGDNVLKVICDWSRDSRLCRHAQRWMSAIISLSTEIEAWRACCHLLIHICSRFDSHPNREQAVGNWTGQRNDNTFANYKLIRNTLSHLGRGLMLHNKYSEAEGESRHPNLLLNLRVVVNWSWGVGGRSILYQFSIFVIKPLLFLFRCRNILL